MILFLYILIYTAESFANDVPKNEWPFYSFQIDDYFRDSNNIQNIKKRGFKSKKEVQAILCKHVQKNCKLDDHPYTETFPKSNPETYFLYRLTEMRSKPNISSTLTGFMIEAVGMGQGYLEIYSTRLLRDVEANASFVMNLKGERMKLMDFHPRGFPSESNANLYFMASSVVPEPDSGVEKDYWIGFKDWTDTSKRLWFKKKTKVYNPKYSVLVLSTSSRDEYFKKLFEISPQIKELYDAGRFEFVDSNKFKFLHEPAFFIKAVDGDNLVLTFFDSVRNSQHAGHSRYFILHRYAYGANEEIEGAYFERIGKNNLGNPINFDPKSKEVMKKVMDHESERENYSFFVSNNYPCGEYVIYKNEMHFTHEPFFWFTRLAEKKYPALEIKFPVANLFNGIKLKEGISLVGFDSPLIFEPAIPDEEGADLFPVEIYLNFQKLIQSNHFARDMTMKQRNDLLEESKKMRLEYCKDRKFVP